MVKKQKSKNVGITLFLAFFLYPLAISYFYLGKIKKALIWLGVVWGTIILIIITNTEWLFMIIFFGVFYTMYDSYKLAKNINYENEIAVKKIQKEKLQLEKERLKGRLKKELAFEKKQNANGLYKFENKWGTKKQIEKWKEAKYGIDQNFQHLSHFEFEEFIAKLFRKMGYKAHTTSKTGDYGIDVIAKKDGKTIAIQCKQNQLGNNVGNVTVQNTLGSMWKIKADKSIIITTSDFTTKAEEQAKEAPVELWDGRYLKKVVRKYYLESIEGV